MATVDEVALRPTRPEDLQGGRVAFHESLLRVTWTPAPTAPAPGHRRWAVLGDDTLGLRTGLHLPAFAMEADPVDAPDAVLVCCTLPDATAVETADAVRDAVHRALSLVQQWLSEERFAATRLVFVTRGAVATGPGEDVTDLAHAAAVGPGPLRADRRPGPVRPGRPRHGAASCARWPAALAPASRRSPSAPAPSRAPARPRAGRRRRRPAALRPGRHRTDHRRHRHAGRAWWPGIWSTGTASGTCCWSSRRGRAAAGAAELRAELTGLGAT